MGEGQITAATTATRNQLTSTYLKATTIDTTGECWETSLGLNTRFHSCPIQWNLSSSSRFAGYFQSRPGTSYASTQGSNSYNGNSWQVEIFTSSFWPRLNLCAVPGTTEVKSIIRRSVSRWSLAWRSCQAARVQGIRLVSHFRTQLWNRAFFFPGSGSGSYNVNPGSVSDYINTALAGHRLAQYRQLFWNTDPFRSDLLINNAPPLFSATPTRRTPTTTQISPS